MNKTVHPTHSCFDDTAEIVATLIKTKRPEHITVIHAICRLPEGSKPYAHAWVEVQDEAFFMGIYNGEKLLFVTPKKDYRKGLDIQETTHYNFFETVQNNAVYNTSGPWKPEYAALCRKSKTT